MGLKGKPKFSQRQWHIKTTHCKEHMGTRERNKRLVRPGGFGGVWGDPNNREIERSTLSFEGVFVLEKKENQLSWVEVMTSFKLEELNFLSPIKKIFLIVNFLFKSTLKKIFTLSLFTCLIS